MSYYANIIAISYTRVGMNPSAADNSAALAAALTAGYFIDGNGQTFNFTSAVSVTGTGGGGLCNATLNFSAAPVNCVTLNGTKGTGVALTGNTLAGANVVTVGSTATFAANQLAFISSAAVWDSETSTVYGQYVRVKTVDSATQLTLFSNVFLAFNTADTAVIAPVTPIADMVIDRVNFIGAGSNSQIGIYATYAENLRVTRCNFRDFESVSSAQWRCYKSTYDDCRTLKSTKSTTSYGYAIWGGCYGASVINSWGEDCRHTVSIGDNDGINMFTRVIGCHAIASKDAGFDSHSASMFTTFANNHVEMSAVQFLTSSHDGMISQGAATTFTGNTVIGPKGVGIYYQPTFQAGALGSAIISNNKIILDDIGYGAIAGHGIYALTKASTGANIESLVISNNDISGGANNVTLANGVYIHCLKNGGTIKNVVVTGNINPSNMSGVGIYVRTQGTSAAITGVNVSNNVTRTTGLYGIFFFADGTTSTITDVTGGGNWIDSATFNLRFNGSVGTISGVRMGLNSYHTGATKIVTAGTSAYIFDDADAAPPVTFTNSTAAILDTANTYFFNRAGTITVTLPDPTQSLATLYFSTLQAQTVVSASSNVCPIGSATPGTAILAASSGAWAEMKSDGTNWRIVAS